MIKVLISLYNKAVIKIREGNNLSDPIKVTEGVLQGETLSPLLFSLFLEDLEKFLLNYGIRGVAVNHMVDILLMGYADDIVILSDSYVGMKQAIRGLFDYCTINKLEVNIKKTKIILFQNMDTKRSMYLSFMG